jgi:hypothetical protein
MTEFAGSVHNPAERRSLEMNRGVLRLFTVGEAWA